MNLKESYRYANYLDSLLNTAYTYLRNKGFVTTTTENHLRSKANAIINLTGTAGGIIVLVLGMVFATSKNLYMQYTGYVAAVCGVMLLGFVLFLLTVKEKKWAEEMEADTIV